MLFDNDIRTATNENITDFTPTFGTYTGAAFQEGVRFSPTSSFNRMMEMNFAQKEREEGDFFPLFGKKFDSTGQLVEIPKTNPKLTKEQAESQLTEHGVKLDIDDSGITQDALSLMIDRKKEELAFTYQINAAPDGVIPTVSKFGASLAASLMDPTNIAAAFIPGIGQAKYLQMMARTTGAAQRAGIRAGFGLAEGVIGTAALEPIIYAAAQQEQADYTMMDSVYNVLIGGVMGAGLHAGIGGISDAIAAGRTARGAQPTGSTAEALAKVPQQSKEAMFKSALAAEGNGYRANVDPVAAFDSQLNPNSRKAMQNSAKEVPPAEFTPPERAAMDIADEPTLDANVQQDVNAGLESGFNETYSTNNSRTADVPSSQAADETVKVGDVELDQSLQSLTDDINDIAARNEVDISGMLDELDVPIRNAETDAKALEAAVLCRINL